MIFQSMMIKIVLSFSILSLMLSAGNINIAVANNVNYAMKDLKKAFSKKYPYINVRVTLSGSGKLNDEYRAFYDFILSDTARVIFKKYGYTL